MRTSILSVLLLSVLAPVPALAYSAGAVAVAERAVTEHALLPPDQLACSDFVIGSRAAGQATEVVVVERHGGACPGDPRQPPAKRFSLFVDRVSGVVQWDYPTPVIFEDLPLPGQSPTVPSVFTSCGVCIQR